MPSEEKIGKVALRQEYYGGEDLYCDGPVEDELLDIVKNYTPAEYEAVIAERCKWPLLYHLSWQRRSIIDFLEDDKNAEVLEIGSGCGAVTGCLAEKFKSVVCVELSKKRSLINAERNRDKDNVEIYVGNFQDVAKGLDRRFDIITLIGVLEYGELYISSSSPYDDFLKKIKGLLKPEGRLIIAIENKLGMKYWAGCREDHTGRFYESVEDYPGKGGICTFGKSALEKMLNAAGYGRVKFYYPYPDYKLADTIYSDDYLPKKGELNNNMRNFDGKRFVAFDEQRAFDSVLEEGLFDRFSNSYLIIAEEE